MRDDIAKPSELPVESGKQTLVRVRPEEVESFRTSQAIHLRLLWDRRPILLRWIGAGLLLSTLVAFVIPKKFESVARLMPPDQSNSSLAMLAAAAAGGGSGSGLGGGLGSGLGNIAGDLLGMKSSGDLFLGVLQSRTVEDDVVDKFNLRSVYGNRYQEDARKNLDNNTEIAVDRKDGIITLHVTDKSPQRAAAMAQEYISELNRVLILSNTSAAHREREFLEKRLAEVQKDLETAETGFSQFASKNTALDIPAQGKAMIEASAALQGELIGAETELESLKQIYANGNVRVRSLQARVDELRFQLQKMGGKLDQTAPSAGQADQAQYPSIRELPLLGVTYADLYRNTKVEEAIFEALTQEYELAKVQEAKETLIVKVLDPPNIPERKVFPPRLLIMIVGTILAMSFCMLRIFGEAYWTEVDSQNPHKQLALEISHAARSHFPWNGKNGSGNGHSNGRAWSSDSEKRSEFDRRD